MQLEEALEEYGRLERILRNVQIDIKLARGKVLLDSFQAKKSVIEQKQQRLRTKFPHIEWQYLWYSGLEAGNSKDNENWIYDGRIYVHREPTIRQKCVQLVMAGFNDMLSEVGLNFELLDAGVFQNQEDVDEYGTVLIFDRYTSSNRADWGTSLFGTMELQLPDGRQHSGFCRALTKHEAAHFLGYGKHHDSTPNYNYPESKGCVMYWEASTPFLCDKCRDAVKFIWKGLEKRTGRRFF